VPKLLNKEQDKILAGEKPLTTPELESMNAYWRACNYLSVGMIYLKDNPLLREPLKTDHVKHRLLGHWGASPALSFVWVHLNRLIVKQDLDMIFVAGPGHGAPGVLGPATSKGPIRRSTRTRARMRKGCRNSSSSSPSPATSAVT
jgi:xylulose-5-phosphate/fructose-6-phosphate phosphoketolase